MHEFRFNLIFHDPGLDKLQYAVKARLGDVACPLHLIDLGGLLQGADGMQDGRTALNLVVGVLGANGCVLAVGAGLHRKTGAGLLVVVEVERLRLGHQAVERTFERRRPLGIADPRFRMGLRFGEFGSLPNRQLFIRFRREQNLTVSGIVGVGEQQQHRLLLVHPGQIKNVCMLLEGQRAVRARGVDVVAEKQGKSTGLHGLHECFSVPGVEVGGEFLVPHAPKVQRRTRTNARLELPSWHE